MATKIVDVAEVGDSNPVVNRQVDSLDHQE
jgi:hypothetical protein